MENKPIPVLIVRFGAGLGAVPLSHVIETMRPLPVETIAGAPAFVLGLSLIRGIPLPVVNLNLLFGTGTSNAVTRYVSLRAGERHLALAVEEVLDVRELNTSALEELPPLLKTASGDAVDAIGALDSQLLILLSTAKLVPDRVWEQWERPEA